MSLKTLPLLFINLGGEMVYILDKRLRAQNIPDEKAKKGKNIKFECNDTIAVWCPSETGGDMFSSQPLDEKQDMILKLEGTGGVELGIISEDPARVVSCWHDREFYQFLNDVKIHKRCCTIHVKIDYEKLAVTSTYGTGIYTQALKSNKKYWLVADIKYGLVEIKIQNTVGSSTKYSFSNIFGKNIAVSNNPTIAQSLSKSPASLCIYRSPLQLGTRLELYSTPKPHQGTTPGRYYLRLFVTDSKPEDLQHAHPDRFDVTCEVTDNPQWTQIETFEKEDCHGKITLDFKNNTMKYMSANGKRSQQDFQPRHGNDVWLVLELYGISVQIKEGSGPRNTSNDGVDMTDAVPLMPRSPTPGFVSVGSNVQPRLMSIQERDENTAQAQRPTDSNSKDAENETVHVAECIRKNFTGLLSQMTSADHIVDMMYQNKYITIQQMEEIRKSEDKVREILMIMSRKPICRTLLEHIFCETEQRFLLPRFLNEEEKR